MKRLIYQERIHVETKNYKKTSRPRGNLIHHGNHFKHSLSTINMHSQFVKSESGSQIRYGKILKERTRSLVGVRSLGTEFFWGRRVTWLPYVCFTSNYLTQLITDNFNIYVVSRTRRKRISSTDYCRMKVSNPQVGTSTWRTKIYLKHFERFLKSK